MSPNTPCTDLRARALAIIFGLLFLSIASAQQTTVNLTATRDNSMYSESGSTSNGAGQFIFTGRTNNGVLRRALVRFDLSVIPANSTIDSVSLAMVCSRVNNNTARATTLNRVTADWGEGTSDATQGGEGQGAAATSNDATWTFRFFNTQSWATAGSDFNATISATTNVGATGTYTWSSATMLSDVQGWYSNSATNFGWVVRGNETTNASAKRFNSRENGTAAQRPILTVIYTPPAPITGACCQSGTCSLQTSAACAAAGGTYQGDNTSCTPNPCPQPTGACCVSGVCSVQTQAACTTAGGTYQGDNVSCTPDPCSGSTVNLSASKDNTLYESTTGALSNGAGIGFIVGRAAAANQRRRGVIAFDLSSIPSNATILTARLRLFMGFTADTAARTINVHKVLADWGEGTSDATGNETGGANSTTNDATWIHRFFNTLLWTNAGGDFTAAASASANVGITNIFNEWTSTALAADVQGWVSTPSTNFGWLVEGAETVNATQRRFESRTNTTVANRPQLIITYTVPPPTGACCFTAGACSVLTSTQCAAQGGTYNGDNTTCSPNPCPQPMGACCLNSASCITATAAACAAQNGTYHGDNSLCGSVTCPLILAPFVDALPVPAVAQPITGQSGGAADYQIGMTEFTQKLHRDLPSTLVWGYNGTFPGPTIEAHRDQPVTVTWINNLRDLATNALRTTHYLPIDTCLHGPDATGNAPVTVVHFHGGHVAPDSDGDPDAAFPPGQSSPLYHYPNDQRACTLWYHDHALGITRMNVYMGLAGAYMLRDSIEDSLNLPRGEYEVPLIIQDRNFNPDGSLQYYTEWHDHFFGKFVLVNGKVWPFMSVKRGKYRFRVVNGSNTRFYTLSLSNAATFNQIGSDQGLLPSPVTISTLTIAPGERADIVIDFAPYAAGTQIVLSNSAPAPFPNGEAENEVANVMRFDVQAATGDTDPLPGSLTTVAPIPESQATFTRSFTLRNLFEPTCNHEAWLINDLRWNDITDFPRLGTTEIWSLVNRSNISHPIHIHLVSFQILDRQPVTFVNDQPVPTGPAVAPPPNEAGWKDVVIAHPFEVTRVIMRFEGFSGLYPIHCHILEHEDHEMMRQFRVLCDAPALGSNGGNVSAALGCSTALSVSATGDELHWKWSHNGSPVSDGPTPGGSLISGSSTATLGISNLTAQDAGSYSCDIWNACGSDASNPISLTVTALGDMNCDNRIDGLDVEGFVRAVLSPGAYATEYPQCDILHADFNNDAQAGDADVPGFVQVLLTGACQ